MAGLLAACELPCIICGRDPAGSSGAWQPGNELDRVAIGAPPGRMRLVFYALCRGCQDIPGVFERVQRTVISECAPLS